VCFLSAVTAADNIIISAAKYYSIFLCVCLCLWAWYWTCFTSGLATGPQQRWRPVRGRTRIRGLKFSERLKECEHDGGRWPVVFVLLWRKVWSSSRSILINFDRRNQIRIDEPAVILQLISDNSQRERERERERETCALLHGRIDVIRNMFIAKKRCRKILYGYVRAPFMNAEIGDALSPSCSTRQLGSSYK
jgi:hypothetical protein